MTRQPLKIDASSKGQTHYKANLESDHLGQWDLIDSKTGRRFEPTVIIESVELYVPARPKMKRMPDGRQVPEKLNKYRIRFVGKRKAWISRPTTQAQIARLHGNNLEGWIGKPITLYVDPNVTMGRDKTGGVRVKGAAADAVPTDEPLDNAVDEQLRRVQDQAFGREDEPREPGSDDT